MPRRAALVLCAAGFVLVAATPPERLGRALYDAGAPRLAAAFLEGPVWSGATLYQRGRYAEAAVAFEGAPFASADYDRGTALAKAGHLKEAAAAFDSALQQDPNDEDARFNLGLVEALRARQNGRSPDSHGVANADAKGQKRSRQAASNEDDVGSNGPGAAGDRDSGEAARTPGRAQVAQAGRAPQATIDARSRKAQGAIGAAEGAGPTGGDDAKVAKSFEELVKLPKKSYSQQIIHPSAQWLETITDDPGRYLRLKLAAERVARAERGVGAPQETSAW